MLWSVPKAEREQAPLTADPRNSRAIAIGDHRNREGAGNNTSGFLVRGNVVNIEPAKISYPMVKLDLRLPLRGYSDFW